MSKTSRQHVDQAAADNGWHRETDAPGFQCFRRGEDYVMVNYTYSGAIGDATTPTDHLGPRAKGKMDTIMKYLQRPTTKDNS